MGFAVSILAPAQADVDHIFEWLNERSPAGAISWYAAFCKAINELRQNAARFPLATESEALKVEIREQLFRTKHGRRYRMLFTIVGQQVRILRVRGPGQAPLAIDGPPTR
jgi:plasmid stabilization system protein ParE